MFFTQNIYFLKPLNKNSFFSQSIFLKIYSNRFIYIFSELINHFSQLYNRFFPLKYVLIIILYLVQIESVQHTNIQLITAKIFD